MEHEKKIILFDGVCNLCNRWVQFVIKRDKADRFRFAALQSDTGRELLRQRSIEGPPMGSIILMQPGIAYWTKSDAVLGIVKEFGGIWKLYSILAWIPRPLRDGIYNMVARNRYAWFGRKEQCMVPSPALRGKFLD